MPSTHFNLVAGDSPLLISIPHLGSLVPDEIKGNLTETGLGVEDTDWHLDRLYDFALGSGASMVSATVSRYVIDLNRPPDGSSLYPGQTTTGLVPLESFHGAPVYLPGMEPDDAVIAQRVEQYWRPYHEALARQLDVIRARHGYALLWEAHSINSELPRLFDGTLPDFNFGTAKGASCDESISNAVIEAAGKGPYSWVLNGRFTGGYITRQYTDPANGLHAMQLEMAQKIYMNEEAPFAYRADLAEPLQPLLASMLDAALKALEALPKTSAPR
jgi:N-formylglutamate deformylase